MLISHIIVALSYLYFTLPDIYCFNVFQFNKSNTNPTQKILSSLYVAYQFVSITYIYCNKSTYLVIVIRLYTIFFWKTFQITISQCAYIQCYRANSRLAASQWETSLQSNAVCHWLRANLESALRVLFNSVSNDKQCCLQLEQISMQYACFNI